MVPATGETAAAREALTALGAAWRIPLGEPEAARLLGFAELLIRWNARINLTGAHTVEAVVAEHFPDSFAVGSILGTPARVTDVGSGGGLPALPLALLRPSLRIRLVEPLAKKVAFLRTAVRELGLTGRVTVEPGRVQDIAAAAAEPVDVALSRATFPPDDWLEEGLKLVRPGGRVLLLTVPETQIPGRRLIYHGGRRVLIEVDRPEECST